MAMLEGFCEEDFKIAAKNGITKSAIWKRIALGWNKADAITKKPKPRGKEKTKAVWMSREYAAYKGDEFLTVGTVYEIAEELGISVQKAKYYTYDSYKKRGKGNAIVLELLTDDEI